MPGDLGQVESGELIMVMLIVLVLLFFGFVAYSSFKSDNLRDEAERRESLQVFRTADAAASLRDIACGFVQETDTACLDKVRLDIVNVTNHSEGYMSDRFGTATITVTQVFPQNTTWTVYNESGNGDRTAVQLPAHIRDPVTKQEGFGYVQVVAYR